MTSYSGQFGPQPLGPGGLPIPATADILIGFQTFAATAAATTVITVPAGRTWQGVVTLSCSASEVGAGTAACQALGVVSTAGAGVVPAAGSYFAVQALGGANVAGGTVGEESSNFGSIPMWVVAPAGNSVTVQVTVTIAGTASRVDCTASGLLL